MITEILQGLATPGFAMSVTRNLKSSEFAVRLPYGFIGCKDCNTPIQANTGRGRPKEYCGECYERRKKNFSKNTRRK